MFGLLKKRIFQILYLTIFFELFLPCSYDTTPEDVKIFTTPQFWDENNIFPVIFNTTTIPYFFTIFSLFITILRHFKKNNYSIIPIKLIEIRLKNKLTIFSNQMKTYYTHIYLYMNLNLNYVSKLFFLIFYYIKLNFLRLLLPSKRLGYLLQHTMSSAKLVLKEFIRYIFNR